MSKHIIRSKKNRVFRILARASSLASIFSFIFGLVGVPFTVIIPISIVFALIALFLSFLIEYAPESIDCFIKAVQTIDGDLFDNGDLLKLYGLQDELRSLIASTEKSVTCVTFTSSQPYL